MASLTIVFERHDGLANFDTLFQEAALPEAVALGEQGAGLAQGRAKVDLGFYRNSITSEAVVVSPGIVSVTIFSTDNPVKVETIENGRKPGTYAPVSVIQAWVARRLAPDIKRLRQVAYLVNRKIFLNGIQGQFVFRNTFQEMQPSIQRAGENVAAKVAKAI